MTKAEVCAEIARTTGIEKGTVSEVVERFMAVVKDSLSKGENVYLRGFGSFIVKERAEKLARDIKKGTQVTVPAHRIPAFRPSEEWKEAVR